MSTDCASLLVCLKEEGPDEVILEDALLLLPNDVDLASTKISVNSINHSGKSYNRLPDARVVS